jgi:hypothetical protein
MPVKGGSGLLAQPARLSMNRAGTDKRSRLMILEVRIIYKRARRRTVKSISNQGLAGTQPITF